MAQDLKSCNKDVGERGKIRGSAKETQIKKKGVMLSVSVGTQNDITQAR